MRSPVKRVVRTFKRDAAYAEPRSASPAAASATPKRTMLSTLHTHERAKILGRVRPGYHGVESERGLGPAGRDPVARVLRHRSCDGRGLRGRRAGGSPPVGGIRVGVEQLGPQRARPSRDVGHVAARLSRRRLARAHEASVRPRMGSGCKFVPIERRRRRRRTGTAVRFADSSDPPLTEQVVRA